MIVHILAKDWGSHKKGTKLTVWETGPIRENMIDPLKAETLKDLGFIEGEEPKKVARKVSKMRIDRG